MEEQTIKLLDECSKGCKMGTDSIEQVKDFVTDEDLWNVIEKYNSKYKKLDDEIAQLLMESGRPEQEPGKMAVMFSWITTEMKLMIKDDSRQIAKLMMDGCNMGIQSISETINDTPEASRESKTAAKRLVKELEGFMKELKEFL